MTPPGITSFLGRYAGKSFREKENMMNEKVDKIINRKKV
jgi:hypothetical protein